MVYVLAAASAFVGVRVVLLVLSGAVDEHRDTRLPSLHHIGRLAWWSVLYAILVGATLLAVPG